ncbi:MAG: hypothetical protein ACPHCI_10610 [Solirubrobacterales bacterium]
MATNPSAQQQYRDQQRGQKLPIRRYVAERQSDRQRRRDYVARMPPDNSGGANYG